MAIYGSIDTIRKMLRGDPSLTTNADNDALIEMYRRAVSSTIDERTGRTFGVLNGPTTRIIYGGGGSVVTLDRPAVSISAVSGGGYSHAGAIVDGEVIPVDYYTYDPVDEDGLIWGVRALYGVWGRTDTFGRPTFPIEITGVWADEGNGSTTVPDDIDFIANYVTTERIKAQKAGPAGMVGPNGEIVPIRDPWKNPEVTQLLNKWSLRKMVTL